MTPTVTETARALHGVGRLLRFDAEGLAFFNPKRQGVLNSFLVAPMVAPIYFAQAALNFPHGQGVDPVHYALLDVLAYVINWTAWPVAMLYLAPMLGRASRYGLCITAGNWFGMVQFGILIPLLALEALLPPGALDGTRLAVFAAQSIYDWFIVKSALGVRGDMAAALVALNFMLALLLAVIGL